MHTPFSPIIILAGAAIISGSVSALNPLEPVEVTDMTRIEIGPDSPHTFLLTDDMSAFELGVCFPANCSITLEASDSVRIIAHVSDKAVNSNPVSGPFYRFDVYRADRRMASHEYPLQGKTNGFVAIKLHDGRLLTGNHTLDKEFIVEGLRLKDSVTIVSSRPSAIVRSVTTLPPRLPEILMNIGKAEDIPVTGDPRQGIWRMTDEEIDTKYGLPGGDYTFGTIADRDTVTIIYLDGAMIHPDIWQPGMIKGVATKDPDTETYDLKWTDAEFNTDLTRPFMRIEGGNMTLSFPYDGAVLRFRKVRQ